jgi:hypothetical protein
MRSKVRILLGANNSFGQPTGEARVLPNPCGGGVLHGSEVYLIGVSTRNGHALERFLVIKNK